MADQIRESGDASALCDQINEKTMAAIECCTFQDITGQRVGKIVKSLQFVEERIDAMVALWGVTILSPLWKNPHGNGDARGR